MCVFLVRQQLQEAEGNDDDDEDESEPEEDIALEKQLAWAEHRIKELEALIDAAVSIEMLYPSASITFTESALQSLWMQCMLLQCLLRRRAAEPYMNPLIQKHLKVHLKVHLVGVSHFCQCLQETPLANLCKILTASFACWYAG